MKQPAYLSALNIHCAASGCHQIVKSNGVAIVTHTELNHRYSPGEKAYLCRMCRHNAKTVEYLTGYVGNWTLGALVEVNREENF